MTGSKDWLFEVGAEKQWCAVVAVRAGRAGKIGAADITWASRVLEALATAGRPMTIAEMMAIAIRDGAPNRRSGMDAAIRHLNGQGLIAPAHRQWAFEPAWAAWFKERAGDSRAIEVRLGVAIAASSGVGPIKGSGERLQAGSVWVEPGRQMPDDGTAADYIKMRDLSDHDLFHLTPPVNYAKQHARWREELIERRKAAGTWDASVETPAAAPKPRRPDGWPAGLPTRKEFSAIPDGARLLYEIPRAWPVDDGIEMLIDDESQPADFRTCGRILKAERQLAGTWAPRPPSPNDEEGEVAEPTDGDNPAEPDEAFDNPHHGHDEAEPAPIMVEIDGIASNAAVMSHARLDQLIGQAHAGMVDCSAADLLTMEAEFERRALAAGEDGLDLGEVPWEP